MALTKITSTNIGANAVTSALIANVSSATITSGLGYTPANKAGDTFTGNIYVGYDGYPAIKFRNAAGTDKAEMYVGTSAGDLNIVVGAGAAIAIDSSGRIRTPYRPAFSAYSGGDTVADGSAVPYATTDFNVGSCYNTSTYRFTAPVAGIYCFIWSNKGTNGQTYYTRLQVNGSARGAPSEHYANIANPHMHASAVVSLAVNDFVWIRSGSNYTRSDSADYFSGYLLG